MTERSLQPSDYVNTGREIERERVVAIIDSFVADYDNPGDERESALLRALRMEVVG